MDNIKLNILSMVKSLMLYPMISIESCIIGSNKSKSQKKTRAFSDEFFFFFIDLSEQLKKVVVTFKVLNEGLVNVDTLYPEVMAIEGYE